MDAIRDVIALLVFPGGLFVISCGLIYEWMRRKLLARMQNRIGPRWFQPLADVIKLLAKEEILPVGSNDFLFTFLPVVAFAGALTAALYVPLGGLVPAYAFPGDLLVTIYLLSLLALCTGLAGANTNNHFSLVGTTRALTQFFSYEAPFLLALLGPAIAAGSWQIGEITTYAEKNWLLIFQPIGFGIAIIGLMGKLEIAPFDAPEAETEIVAGAFTEYSGRGWAIFRLTRNVELVIGLTLIAAFYLGGFTNPLDFLIKTFFLLFVVTLLQAIFTRLRIDQTVGLWWRYGALLALAQMLVVIVLKGNSL